MNARASRKIMPLCAVLAAICGCQAPSPRAADRPDLPPSNAALLDYIASQPYVSAEAAYRAIHILWQGEVFVGDFDALAQKLRTGKIIPARWRHAPDTPMDRPAVGYMVCRAAGIRTGINWQLTGTGRYAWRELNYLGIASPPSEYGYVSGGQFVGILARAEDYMHRRRIAEAPVDLGPEPR